MDNIIYTHSGLFHVDELMAIALLQRFVFNGQTAQIVRSRDNETTQKAVESPDTFVVDTGRNYAPEYKNFDHHQEGGAGSWEDGTPMSSCGLVWSWLREQKYLSDIPEDELDLIEKEIIKPVDRHDNGVQRWPLASMFRLYNRIGANPETTDRQFYKALSVANELIENQLHDAGLELKARARLEKCWKECQEQKDGIVIVPGLPTHQAAHKLLGEISNYQANLMVYPQNPGNKNKKWFIRGLPDGLNSDNRRMSMPVAWRGKTQTDIELENGQTVKVHFVHNSGFLACIEGTLHDAYMTAQAVFNHPENKSTFVLPENSVQTVKEPQEGSATTLDRTWGQSASSDILPPKPTT